MSYRLNGQARGEPLVGNAYLLWQRQGVRYQAELNLDVKNLVNLSMTSQGTVTPDALVPQAYEESRLGKRRKVLFGSDMITLNNGQQTPQQSGIQDAVSQFVDLGHRFTRGRAMPRVGETVSLPLGRPSSVNVWSYDVVDRQMLHIPPRGELEVFHLKPRPMASAGGALVEMWLAPNLQYLPVKIRVSTGESDYIDLTMNNIELR